MKIRDEFTATAEGDANWRATLIAMVGVQFVMSVALTGMSPVFPLFLPDVGVTDRATVEFWAGILNAGGFLAAAIMSPLWGQMADRYGRKMMVLRSSTAICVFSALMGLSTSVWHLFALRMLMGIFSGFSASAIALVASQVPERRLGSSLGWLSTGQLTGSLIGPLLGGSVADLAGSYRLAFLMTSLLAGTAMLLALRMVRETFVFDVMRKRPGLIEGFQLVFTNRALVPLLVVLLLAQFGTRTVQPVVSLFVQDLVGQAPNIATLAGFAFSVTGFADLIASPFLGKRSDVLGYRRVLLICIAGAAIFTLPQAVAHHYWEFVAERFAVGLFIGGILPTANALIGRSVSSHHRGLVYGTTASATFLGSFLGPFSGGTIASLYGIRVVFVVTACTLGLNWLWVLLQVPKGPPEMPSA